jgi:hypothetical protein
MPAAKPTPEEVQLEKLRALRVPFAQNEIGKLPKPYRRDSQKGYCRECNGNHGLPAAHIDYVGHAALTNRLLEVDPLWHWEPFALDAMGLPAIVNGNLWIRLTVAGVTRIGVGDAEGGNSLKIMIGDALRNAGMRFGMALDLWSKEDLHDFSVAQGKVEAPKEDIPPAAREAAKPADTPNPVELRLRAIEEFNQRIQQLGEQDLATFRQRWVEAKLPKLSLVDEAQFKAGNVLLAKLEKEIADRPLYADPSLETPAETTDGDYAEPPAEYYDDGVQSPPE